MPLFAQKANKVITVSNYSKNDIVNKYKVNSEKIKKLFIMEEMKFSNHFLVIKRKNFQIKIVIDHILFMWDHYIKERILKEC